MRMKIADWAERWRQGRIGFHEGRPNAFLERHIERLSGKRVLVPLCGKAEDLAFLASHGHEVIGIEVVEDAARAFFAEHGLEPNQSGKLLSAGNVTILVSDFFAVEASAVGPIDAFYDRAALIALPPTERDRYVAHLRTLAPGAPGLLVAFDYPQAAMAGPPFAVGDTEVRRLFGPSAALLDERVLDEPGRFRDLGIRTTERAYVVNLGA